MTDSDLQLRDRQEYLIKIIEASEEVLKTKGWQVLRELLWDGEVQRIERLILAEAKSDEPQLKQLYRLQGELSRARRYSDLKGYAETFAKELKAIKDKLQ